MAMPWSRAKQISKALRGAGEFPEDYTGSRTPGELVCLFVACFRIQREACEAAGRYIPMVVENVKGAQPWVGRAKANFGSFYLWGDVGMVGNRVACGATFGNYIKPTDKCGAKQMASSKGFSHPGSNGHNTSSLGGPNDPRRFGSKSSARKAASAQIAKIPLELSQYVARCYRPKIKLDITPTKAR